MPNFKQWLTDRRYLKISLYIVLTVGLLYILFFSIKNIDVVMGTFFGSLSKILTALSPLFIGLFIAYLLNPIVEWIDRHLMIRFLPDRPARPRRAARRAKNRRLISVLLTVILVVVLLVLLIYAFAFLIVGRLAFDSLSIMLTKITEYFLQYKDIFDELVRKMSNSGLEEKAQEIATIAAKWISEHVNATSVFRYIGNFGSSLLGILLGLVVAIYLLKDKTLFLNLWEKTLRTLFKPKTCGQIKSVLDDINTVFSKFLRGQLLDALIIAILSSIALTMVGLRFSVLIGCFAGLTNIIPYFGPIIGAVPAALVGLLDGGIGKAIAAVVVLFVLQQIDANLIYPKVVGQTTGLHPVAILIAVSFGGYFWGLIGMVLAVPFASCLKLFGMRLVKSRQIVTPLPEEGRPKQNRTNRSAGDPPDPKAYGSKKSAETDLIAQELELEAERLRIENERQAAQDFAFEQSIAESLMEEAAFRAADEEYYSDSDDLR